MKDLFSHHSDQYARYRPTYPETLYQFVLSCVRERQRAWDCATGNGQVAARLAAYFREVEATDLSPQQLAQAPALPNVRYAVSRAEQTPFPAGSFDLVTVGQALHWFDAGAFYAEVRRVLRPGGVLAVWGYELLHVSPVLDPLLEEFYRHTVGPYWAPERRHLEARYQTLPFPFEEVPTPAFSMTKTWTRADLLGYLGTWSAVAAYRQDRGTDPVAALDDQLRSHWPDAVSKPVTFPVFLRLGT